MLISTKKFILNGKNITRFVDSIYLYADGILHSGSFQVFVNLPHLPLSKKYDFTCLTSDDEVEISGSLEFWGLDTSYPVFRGMLGTHRHKLTFWIMKSLWKDGLLEWLPWRLQRVIKTGR